MKTQEDEDRLTLIMLVTCYKNATPRDFPFKVPQKARLPQFWCKTIRRTEEILNHLETNDFFL